jgi:hypothetical protein
MIISSPPRLYCCWVADDCSHRCDFPARFLIRTRETGVRCFACSMMHAQELTEAGDTIEPLPGAGE